MGKLGVKGGCHVRALSVEVTLRFIALETQADLVGHSLVIGIRTPTAVLSCGRCCSPAKASLFAGTILH